MLRGKAPQPQKRSMQVNCFIEKGPGLEGELIKRQTQHQPPVWVVGQFDVEVAKPVPTLSGRR